MASTVHPYATDPHFPAATPDEIYEGVTAVVFSEVFEEADSKVVKVFDTLMHQIIWFTNEPFELNGELVVEFALLDLVTLRIASHEILRAHELGLVPDSNGRWNDRYASPVMLVAQV